MSSSESSQEASDIRIDKEGVWYYRGAEMFRKDIVQMLYQNIKRDQEGRYLVEIGADRAYLEVEDTPYVIRAVSRQFSPEEGKEVIHLHLPDDSTDELDPSTLCIGADNAMYGMMVRSGFEARFSRSSYYQLAEHIESEPGQDKFYICLNGHRYYIENKDDV